MAALSWYTASRAVRSCSYTPCLYFDVTNSCSTSWSEASETVLRSSLNDDSSFDADSADADTKATAKAARTKTTTSSRRMEGILAQSRVESRVDFERLSSKVRPCFSDRFELADSGSAEWCMLTIVILSEIQRKCEAM